MNAFVAGFLWAGIGALAGMLMEYICEDIPGNRNYFKGAIYGMMGAPVVVLCVVFAAFLDAFFYWAKRDSKNGTE